MTQNSYARTTTAVHAADPMSPGGRTDASQGQSVPMACGMGHRGLTGLFLMMACCVAPLLLVLALPVLGTGLGGPIALSVQTLAVFACPVGMALMMWRMRGRRIEAQPPIQEQSVKAARRREDEPSTQDTAAHLRQ